MKDGKNLLVLSLSIVFVVFGFYKVLGTSSIKPLVEAILPFMSSPTAFGLMGILEIALGLGLFWKNTRKYASLVMVLYLGGIMLSSVFALDRMIVNGVISVEGEFVLKNLVLLAAAYTIFVSETPIKWSKLKFKIQ